MKVKHLPLIFLTFFLSIPNSYALICQKYSSGAINDSVMIDYLPAIPSTLPKGTILWRQPRETVNVECWVEINGRPGETIYLYTNPRNEDLGKEIEAGITYQGKDYLFSSLVNGRLDIGWSVRGCPEGDTCGWKKEKKTLTYSVFFAKKSPPAENKEGPLAPTHYTYPTFQIDGQGGVRPGKSYNVSFNGIMYAFRYAPCASTVSISPRTIDFAPIGTIGAKAGATIEEAPFTITEQRSCNAVYGVNGNLQPLNAALSSDGKILIPTDNDSVGITILDASDQTVIPFKREFVLSPKSSFQSNSREFLARLMWMDDKPKLGHFNAGATLNIYYR